MTGVWQGALSVDVHLHDTYFIVGHFHYVMFGGTGFGFFASLLYWFPKMFGRMYSKKAIYISWFPMFVGFNMLYFSMLILGIEGMPRRYFNHLPRYNFGHDVATVGSWILISGLLIFFGALLSAVFRGKKAGDNPWHGVTLEWTVPSPPPVENFDEIPEVTSGPYSFGREVEV